MERKNVQKTLDILAGTALVTETVLFLTNPGFQEMLSANPEWALPAIISFIYISGRVLLNMPDEGSKTLWPIAKKSLPRTRKLKK